MAENENLDEEINLNEENSCENEDCSCENCEESEECSCDEKDCSCDEGESSCDECKHDEECDCACESDEECERNECTCSSKAEEYLDIARRMQADFENYRKRAEQENKNAFIKGQESVISIFLPSLDTFKEAKKSITDENILKGVEMIEEKISQALKSLGVEKIDTVGQVYNPHLHNVIAVMKDPDKENDIILEEFQAGYKFNDKVIRYSKVIVNKKEEN